ncbi:hypothetical protein BX600DRAFT_438616 [Xylariales sp. PMI_506]|nr:hypothetical protein BX600DRAFT_438616 [Xylariales sp. PMI_506]
MSNTVVLITGANRGLGSGLVKTYLARPSTTVIAAVRDPKSATSQALSTLPKASDSSLIIVTLDAASTTSAKSAIQEATNQGVTRIDVAIANAGVANWWGPAAEVPISAMQEHFTINTLGSLLLFQAALPLLEKSNDPKFVYISTTIGSIGGMEKYPFQGVAYGTSKVAMNYITKKLHLENEKITIFNLHPGWVRTEMGNRAGEAHNFGEADITIEESVNGMIEQIDKSTKAATSGGYVTFDGNRLPW